jgi:hypothetical protein
MVEVQIMPRRSTNPTFSQSVSLDSVAADYLEFLTFHLETSASDVIRKALKMLAGQAIVDNPQLSRKQYHEIVMDVLSDHNSNR